MTRPETLQHDTRPDDMAGRLSALDEDARVRLGAAAGTAPGLLRELAQDRSVTVRAAVAMNRAAPGHIDILLASDRDERVRTLIGRKLASLIPDLTQAQHSELEEHALAALARLVEDEAVRVRAAIADVVKSMPGAPRDLILRLARDSAMPVCEPVIRLSPLLSAEDLLALLSEAPAPGTAEAIASRPDLAATVADAIAASADDRLVGILLANRSAAIREATLDTVIARASTRPDWHDPLVRRPTLSARAARALSEIVTTQLLAVLASRGDLDVEISRELERRVVERMPKASQARRDPSLDEAIRQARELLSQHRLDEAAVLAAARRGEARLCSAMLALASGVAPSVVDRAVTLRSVKGVVSLIWKAGFSMRLAGPLQVLLCRAGPAAVLLENGSGGFPLAVDEMCWQLDFLQRMEK